MTILFGVIAIFGNVIDHIIDIIVSMTFLFGVIAICPYSNPSILLYMKGAKKVVSASDERQSLGGLPQSEWFLLQWHSSWVVHLAEQFLLIVLEFQEYYKEKCRSHTATPCTPNL